MEFNSKLYVRRSVAKKNRLNILLGERKSRISLLCDANELGNFHFQAFSCKLSVGITFAEPTGLLKGLKTKSLISYSFASY